MRSNGSPNDPAAAETQATAETPAPTAPDARPAGAAQTPAPPTPRSDRFRSAGASSDAAFLQTEASVSLSASCSIELPPRFELRRSLGAGGMGEVVLAHDRVLGRDVAIKVLKSGVFSDDTTRERLLNEAQAAAQIQHPNIVSIHDVDLDHGLIVMEYMPRGSGRKLIEERGKLPLSEVLRIARQLCSAIEAAHAAGLVHRDIKPDNVLFDRDGAVKIADFGVAQSRRRTTSGGSEVVGTPAYMAPEQLRGAATDPRADIYALGLTFYELACGQRFHTPEGPADSSPAGLARAVKHRGLAQVLSKCLAEDPAQRYASARDLEDALAALTRRRQRLRLVAVILAMTAAIAIPLVLYFTKGVDPGKVALLKVAALPFQNQTGERRLEWLRQGFANFISSGLRRRGLPAIQHSRLRDLVSAEGDITAWEHAARQEGANEILTGAFMRDGTDLLVTARFRNETYTARGRSARADTIAEEIVHALSRGLLTDAPVPKRRGRPPEAVRAFELGYAAVQQHQFQRAAEHLREAIRLDPDYAEARYALITALSSQQGTSVNIVAEVDEALSRRLDDRERALFEALKLRVARRYDEAAKRYDKLRSDYPGEKEAHYGLADSLFHLGRAEQAIAAFKQLVRLAPNFHLAYQHPTEYHATRGQWRDVNAYIYFLRRAAAPANFLAMMEVRLEVAKRKYRRAIDRGKSVVQAGADVMAALAGAQAIAGDIDSARESYAQASALNPEDRELRTSRAALDLSQGQIADFQSDSAWESEANEPLATVANRLSLRGLLYALLGRTAEAKRDLDEVQATAGIEVQRRLPRLAFFEGLYRLLTKDALALGEFVKRVGKHTGPEVPARVAEVRPFLAGALLATKGQHAEAMKRLQDGYKAREDGHYAPVFLMAMARIAAAAGDHATVAAHCEEILRPPFYSPLRAGAVPPCLGLLARAREAQGRQDDAKKHARALLALWKYSAVEIPELAAARRIAGPLEKGPDSREP
jgi:tetratricopeptide (TPR) repeat protein